MKERLNPSPDLIKVGDLVTTDLDWRERGLVRRIVAVQVRPRVQTGLWITADAGDWNASQQTGRGPIAASGAWFMPASMPEGAKIAF